MSGVRVCTCGMSVECPGDCAGAQLHRLECAIEGHLTAQTIYRQAWGHDRVAQLTATGFCFRCGDDVE